MCVQDLGHENHVEVNILCMIEINGTAPRDLYSILMADYFLPFESVQLVSNFQSTVESSTLPAAI
jgi:hypothetical protein